MTMMSELVDVHNVSGVSGRNKTAFRRPKTERKIEKVRTVF